MNNDIKEILKVLEIKSKRYNHHLKYGVSYENTDEDYQAHLLLDYITNLQEEKENYKSRNEKAIELINAWLEELNNDDIIILLNDLGNILKGSE